LDTSDLLFEESIPVNENFYIFLYFNFEINFSMKSNLFVSIMTCSLLAAGQVQADGAEYLPTVAYREGKNMKIEYAYDVYGHIVFEKQYHLQGGEYVWTLEQTMEYYQLPNGEFVMTKNESFRHFDLNGDGIMDGTFGWRTTSAYDNRGVQLLELVEQYSDGEWTTDYRLEAILDANGIRTGLLSEGEGFEDAGISFDSRGRTVRIASNGLEATYTWNDRDELTAFKYPVETEDGFAVMEAQNIRSVYNGKYVNPYKLMPWSPDEMNYTPSPLSDSNYAWDDYTLHFWLFDADVTLDGVPMTIRSTVDEALGEMQLVMLEGETVVRKYDFKTGANGSWTKTSVLPEWWSEGSTFATREYDSHGALTGISNIYSDGLEHEQTWVREYDAEGRPVKTTCFYGLEMNYVETYEDWTATGNDAVVEESAGIWFYNGVLTVRTSAAERITVYSANGAPVYRTEKAEGSATFRLDHLPRGVYIARGASGWTRKFIR
jgi:hypothetical protein